MTTVHLERDCGGPGCLPLADHLYGILHERYRRGQALMLLPVTIADWEATHRTARKRCFRAERLGNRVEYIEPAEQYDGYVEINHSMPERQGRPMTDAYQNLQRSTSLVGDPQCPRHHTRCYGVLNADGKLVAYSTFHRCGFNVHLSQFLGHADHLEDGIMYLLLREVMRDQIPNGPGFVYYNFWDGGQEGLRFFKERMGFSPEDINWTL